MGKRRTLMLVNMAGIMERADEALLPAVYKEVGAALHASPTGLGSLTLFRSIVQSLCYPLAAYAAIHYNRAHVIAVGAFLWAAATFLVALSSTYLQVAFLRALNGIGLALVMPAIQSLVADSTDDDNRGVAFGWLHLTGMIGSILGGLISFSLATSTFIGIEGWRFAFHLVAIISVIVGVLVRLFAVDPNYVDSVTRINALGSSKSVWTEVEELVKEAKTVMKIQSFQLIVVQGITGSFPWSALLFAPMWLELIGFSHNMTGFLMFMFVIANALGGLFGGKIGDYLSTRFPNSGRIILSQISSASAIPLAAVLMLVLPDDPSTVFSHVLVLFIMGLSMSWNSVATNNPIFAEIVPEKSRASIYALARSFESVLSSSAPPFVGILAQYVFGYKPIPYGSSKHNTIEVDRENAVPLAKALYTAIAVPMALCCLIYSFLYCTYPRDRERAHMVSLVESEMQQRESENSPGVEDYSQSSQTGRELFQKERRVNDTVYVEDLEIGDNVEKMLLSGKLSTSR